LIAIAFGSFHIVRSRARERLRLSCGLRGNGMCFSTQLLREVPHRAYSVVEDVEYGIRLGEAGYRVHYTDEAHVYGEMVTTSAAADSQRRRWEEGRRQLVRDNARRLLKAGLARRDRVLFDLGLDLLVPPLSRIAVGMLAAELAGLGLVALGAPGAAASIYAVGTAAVGVYVLRGWQVSGTGWRRAVRPSVQRTCSPSTYRSWRRGSGTLPASSSWDPPACSARSLAASVLAGSWCHPWRSPPPRRPAPSSGCSPAPRTMKTRKCSI
jgi:hypothetical protein